MPVVDVDEGGGGGASRVAVAGGTGVVGRYVVRELARRGHDHVVLSRSSGVDLTSGRGLEDRLAGVVSVIDVSNTGTQRRAAAEAFFGGVTERLLAAGERHGVTHHVTLSIVGADDVDTGYYAGKRRQEQALTAGPVPWSLLRTTQFHEFAEQALGFARLGPVSLVPRMRTQPVAAAEVAEALVDLALGPPVGRAPDLGGPEAHELVELSRRLVAATASRRRVVPVRLPGAGGRAMREGALLPGPGARRARTGFDEWLAARE
jgi:uncharacterized protein YbjT (DUF2867 family)